MSSYMYDEYETITLTGSNVACFEFVGLRKEDTFIVSVDGIKGLKIDDYLEYKLSLDNGDTWLAAVKVDNNTLTISGTTAIKIQLPYRNIELAKISIQKEMK